MIKKLIGFYNTSINYFYNNEFDNMGLSTTFFPIAFYFEVDHDDDYIGYCNGKFYTKSGSNTKFLGCGNQTNSLNHSGRLEQGGNVVDYDEHDFFYYKDLIVRGELGVVTDIIPEMVSNNTIFIDDNIKVNINYNAGDIIDDSNYVDWLNVDWDRTVENPLNPIITTNINFGHKLEGLNVIKTPQQIFSIYGFDSTFYDVLIRKQDGYNTVYFFDGGSGDNITFDKPSSAQKYADTGDNSGDDEKYIPDSDDPNGDDVNNYIENNELNSPDDLILELNGTNLYEITPTILHDFFDFFWDKFEDTSALFINQFTGLYANLSQNVVSVRCFLTDVDWKTIDGTVIQLGKYTSEVQAPRISEQKTVKHIGTLKWTDIEKKTSLNNSKSNYFLIFQPYTKAKMYLPYYGIVDINLNKLHAYGTLNVYLEADVITGTGTYFLRWKNGNTETIESSFECQLAIDVPIALQDSLDTQKKMLDSAMTLTASIGTTYATGGLTAPMLISSLSNNWGDDTTMTGGNVTTSKLFAPDKISVVLEISNTDYAPSYNKTVGYPCNNSYKLSELVDKGYTKTLDAQLRKKDGTSIFNDVVPTENEITMIITALNKGVVL